MTASELYRAGRLQEAIAAQVQEVKARPADQGKRLFLFEMLAFAGDLDRARKQLEAIHYDDPEVEAAGLVYRKLLDAEEARRRLFRDGVAPQFLAEPPAHVALRLEAINRLREDRSSEALSLLARAAGACTTLAGRLNDKPFAGLRDIDDLFGPVLEVMAHGAYYWVPLQQVSAVTLNPPRFPRDLLWAPARLEMRDDSAGAVYLPALYPGSHQHANDAVKLGRMTDWLAAEGGPVRGAGQHTFQAGDEEIGLLEWRQLEIDGSC
jgi:type VI secretion system protein ImpE